MAKTEDLIFTCQTNYSPIYPTSVTAKNDQFSWLGENLEVTLDAFLFLPFNMSESSICSASTFYPVVYTIYPASSLLQPTERICGIGYCSSLLT